MRSVLYIVDAPVVIWPLILNMVLKPQVAWNKGQGHKRLFVALFSPDSLRVWPSRGIHSCLSGYLNIVK